jgi:RNA polymerase sigma-70 factor (ECF subfamily)
MEDDRIIELYFDRDEQAIRHTADKYGAYCTAVSMNILHSEPDAEECVNDTYLRAWEAIPPQYPDKLSAFLGKITRNLALDKYRYYSREKPNNGQTALVLEELSVTSKVLIAETSPSPTVLPPRQEQSPLRLHRRRRYT